jgi:hypothetical protein
MDIRIDSIQPFAEGLAFGSVGPYERLKGVARGTLDPEHHQHSRDTRLSLRERYRSLDDYVTEVQACVDRLVAERLLLLPGDAVAYVEAARAAPEFAPVRAAAAAAK